MRIKLLVAWILLTVAAPAAAQENDTRYDLIVRGVPLHQALERLAYITGIDLVYTSADVEGKRSYCDGRNFAPPQLLSCVLEGSDLDFVRSSSGAYVLIEAVAAAPRFGRLAGSIRDADTGEPLPYANVLLADARTGTSTNESGLFSFASLLTGPHHLVVTYVGYETATDSIWIAPGEHEHVRIALKSAESSLAPVVVSDLTQRLPSGGLGRADRASEALRSAGPLATSDVTRGLTSVAGVAVHQPLADLHIQGGSSGEHATLLDGVPVRDPVSLGRYLSAFSPLALGRITIHKAGFGAQAGSHLSGVVDVRHDVSTTGGDHFAASLDPISVNGRAETRFDLRNGGEGAAMIAGRSSIWGAYRDPAVSSLLASWQEVDPLAAPESFAQYPSAEETVFTLRSPDVQFSDLHGAVRLQYSPFRTLYASLYRARNRLVSDFASARSFPSYGEGHLILTRDRYDWTNWVGQARHSWLLGARAALTTQIAGSWNDSRYGYHGLYDSTGAFEDLEALSRASRDRREDLSAEPDADEDNHIRELTWTSRFNYSASARHQFDADVSLSHIRSHFYFDNEMVSMISHSSSTWMAAGSVEGSHHLGLGTVIEPGLRLTYLPNRETVYAEPRLAVRHDASAGALGEIAVRLAGGLYRQYVNQLDVTSSGVTALVPTSIVWLPLDGDLSPPRAIHVAADVLIMPAPTWSISAEVFRKWQQRLLVLDYAGIAERGPSTSPSPLFDQRHFMTAALGDVRGASLRVQRTGRIVSPDVAYSYVRAQRRYPDRFGGTMQPVPWNTPHRVTADLTAKVSEEVQLLANWEGGWGRKWALRQSYYDYLAYQLPEAVTAPFDLQDPSAAEAPSYRRLDLGLSLTTRWTGFEAEFRVFATNVMNRRNVYDFTLQPEASDMRAVARTLPGRHLFFSLHLSY